MNRICYVKKTGKLIEFQSDKAPIGTLTANAVNAGYNESDIVEEYTDKSIDVVISEREPQKTKTARLARRDAFTLAMAADKTGMSLDQRINRLETILGV